SRWCHRGRGEDRHLKAGSRPRADLVGGRPGGADYLQPHGSYWDRPSTDVPTSDQTYRCRLLLSDRTTARLSVDLETQKPAAMSRTVCRSRAIDLLADAT